MRRLIRYASRFLLALVCCLFFVGSAAAAPAPPSGNDILLIGTNVSPEVLERAYQAELAHLARQDRALSKAAAYLDRAEASIAELAAAGYDTTALEEAVEASRASLAEARVEWTAAKAVLEEAAGFDEDGTVTDPELAHTTLHTAAQHMRQVHAIGTEALAAMMEAIDEFLVDNPGFVFPRRPSGPPALELALS
jgi:hypothetical protein